MTDFSPLVYPTETLVKRKEVNAQSPEETITAVQLASSPKDHKNKHITDSCIMAMLDEIDGTVAYYVLSINQVFFYTFCVWFIVLGCLANQ